MASSSWMRLSIDLLGMVAAFQEGRDLRRVAELQLAPDCGELRPRLPLHLHEWVNVYGPRALCSGRHAFAGDFLARQVRPVQGLEPGLKQRPSRRRGGPRRADGAPEVSSAP